MPQAKFKYMEIVNSLTERIRDGEYVPGDMLPGQRALMDEYKMSWSTVIKAMEYLARKGIVERRQGFGTLVAEPPTDVWETVVAPIVQTYMKYGWYVKDLDGNREKYRFCARQGNHEISLIAKPADQHILFQIGESEKVVELDLVALHKLASMNERGRLRIFYLALEASDG